MHDVNDAENGDHADRNDGDDAALLIATNHTRFMMITTLSN